MGHLSIFEFIELEALNGKQEVYLNLWKRTIESLQKKGLVITPIHEICYAKYYCKVSWKECMPESVDEENYSIANNLWLMAQGKIE